MRCWWSSGKKNDDRLRGWAVLSVSLLSICFLLIRYFGTDKIFFFYIGNRIVLKYIMSKRKYLTNLTVIPLTPPHPKKTHKNSRAAEWKSSSLLTYTSPSFPSLFNIKPIQDIRTKAIKMNTNSASRPTGVALNSRLELLLPTLVLSINILTYALNPRRPLGRWWWKRFRVGVSQPQAGGVFCNSLGASRLHSLCLWSLERVHYGC